MSKDFEEILKGIARIGFNQGYEGYIAVFYKSYDMRFSFDITPLTCNEPKNWEKVKFWEDCFNAVNVTAYDGFEIFNQSGEIITKLWRDMDD